MVPGTSKQQQAILDFIVENIAERGYPPTLREICEQVGLTSASSASYQLQQMEQKGLIKRTFDRARSIQVIRETEVVHILNAIKAVRDEAAEERAQLQANGEPLTDYGSGVLDGLDRAWLAGTKASHDY